MSTAVCRQRSTIYRLFGRVRADEVGIDNPTRRVTMKRFLLAVDFSSLLQDGKTHMDMREVGYQGNGFKYAPPDIKAIAFVRRVVDECGPESLVITAGCTDKEQSREVRSFVRAQLTQVHGIRVKIFTTCRDYFTCLKMLGITHVVVKWNEARDLEEEVWRVRNTGKTVPFFMIRVCNNLNFSIPTGQFPVSEVSSWARAAELVAKLPK